MLDVDVRDSAIPGSDRAFYKTAKLDSMAKVVPATDRVHLTLTDVSGKSTKPNASEQTGNNHCHSAIAGSSELQTWLG